MATKVAIHATIGSPGVHWERAAFLRLSLSCRCVEYADAGVDGRLRGRDEIGRAASG
ncbi:hypothetical protein [Hyphomicrobium sp. 1Nfss2.1]|uniref:hypothetical protein n=1 Tax=Hyphomicrobium sp. 1Nfss2.1 TaxID=3413936 RepID=UPI003C7B76F0